MIGVAKIGVAASRGGGGVTPVNPDFVTTWNVASDGETVTLPLESAGTFNGTIDWGDGGATDTLSYANRQHTYTTAGTYTITISGTTFEGWRFAFAGDRLKITDVSNWGFFTITGDRTFDGCFNLEVTATDAPIITTTSFYSIFRSCDALTTPDFSNWDTSSVANMQEAFANCDLFNGNVNGWVHSGVTSVYKMFINAIAFNQDLDTWDTSAVINMYRTFTNAVNMNGDIRSWNTSSATNMGEMLRGTSIDQDLSSWDINQVTNFSGFGIGITLSTANYDALLIAWDAQGAMSYSGTVNFGNSQYTSGGAAEAARTSLISKWGGITDGGAA